MPAPAVRARRGQWPRDRAQHRRAARHFGRRPPRALFRSPGARFQPRPEGSAGQRAGICAATRCRTTDAAHARHRATAARAVSAPEPRARRHGRDRAPAPRLARAPAEKPATASRGGRPAAPAVELVQRRLSADAASRLELAGATARADHPPRGGARDRWLGRPAAPPAARPPLFCILPSTAARRAAHLRRGGAGGRDGGRDRAADRQEVASLGERPLQGRRVLFDQQLPAGPAQRLAAATF